MFNKDLGCMYLLTAAHVVTDRKVNINGMVDWSILDQIECYY